MSSLVRLKHYLCSLFYLLFISHVINRCIKLWYGNRASLVVLCYHSIKEEEAGLFERQLDYLVDERGFKVISGTHVAALIRAPEDFDRNTRYVCLTFDDCYLDNYSVVREILRRRNLGAIFFAATQKLGTTIDSCLENSKEQIMSSLQLQQMAQDFDIGAHTQHHIRLAEVDRHVAEREILGSKDDLKELLGKDINFFAYPNGSYNGHALYAVNKGQFAAAFTIEQHTNYNYTEKYRLGRYLVQPSDNWVFKLKVNGGYDWFFFLRETIGRIIDA